MTKEPAKVVVEVLIPRMGGYRKWERSDPMTSAQAKELITDCRAIGYRTRLIGGKANRTRRRP